MTMVELRSTVCAICKTEGNCRELYPATIGDEAFQPSLFSARRTPDRVHYRIVKCLACGLVRSDPVARAEDLAGLYRQSSFNYSDETGNLNRTYGRYLDRLEGLDARKGSLLEIGCGSGFFLAEALRRGYPSVSGVEPAVEAVEKASPEIRSGIRTDIMHRGLFEPGSFDVICMFQVLDHLPDPAAVLEECFRLLNPGGVLLAINHNVEALSARLLGERSPIIDVEHTYLYSPGTMRRLFEQSGYRVVELGGATNDISLGYLARLFPLPAGIKRKLLSGLKHAWPGKVTLRLPLGNLHLAGKK